ncbi:MAG: RNA polymerase subunit sigma-70 [Lactobacillaceae bacterium]|nr:RNA polymerase subunit sigma-70 [Lactobacillaceae bacterium]
MALLPAIDEQKTIENVRQFFDHDFPRLQNMAHISYVSIKSPVISGMPTGSTYSNVNDEKVSSYVYANNVLDSVLEACRSMTFPHRDFMELRYFKGLTWMQVQDRKGYSDSRGYQIIREAFLQFADAFADTEDFRIFK